MAEKENKKAKVNEEELKKKLEEEIGRIKVKDVVTQTMITLSSLGYQKLGLPEETNKKYKDLEQAKLAIDCFSALLKASERSLSEEEAKTFKNTLASLQLTFVAQSKEETKS